MKNLKTLSHSTKTLLANESCRVKHTHILELVAAAHGFNSHAAYSASSNVVKVASPQEPIRAEKCIFHRALELGYESQLALKTAQVISSQQYILEEPITEYVKEYLGCCDSGEAERFEDFDNFSEDDEEVFNLEVVELLKHFINQGNHEHIYLALLLSVNEISHYHESYDMRAAEHWLAKSQSGAQLSLLQQEILEAYKVTELFNGLLGAVERQLEQMDIDSLNRPKQVLDLRSHLEQVESDASVKFSDLCYLDPLDVVYALEFLLERIASDAVLRLHADWYRAYLLKSANKESIASFIGRHISNEEAWFWYYFGLSRGFDITESNHIGINRDTGEEWDGYGPVVVGGYDGIELPHIDLASKTKVELFVKGY
ncbi:hypothetical protein W04_1157 [Pseudoalteromonas sp. SW0106-04]|uniref:hypothetical protein n=1 Tax=Pseudoalteromonas sp. SW0106-04 TaxID=1702169 RepID=UPI0006B4E592|nr:hypothetical protein [Pseudoalteromonas sp. SW0106-04]GAP74639.1 hypothetical protein W04_1157 [Pseudoalteromonas sp. SW0106-04]